MEKEPQPDSLSEVTVKQYAASEVYSTEPPPAPCYAVPYTISRSGMKAYHRPQSTSVQIARIAAITLVAVSVVLGGFILAAAYVNANASCQHLQQELEMLQEASERLQPLQPEALTQEETQQQPHRHHSTETHAEQKEEQANDKEIEDNSISSQESTESEEGSDEEDDRTPIHIKLPLQLDFDELAGALMEKNQRSRMNCIVEKKKAEEVVDHQAKTVRLPFGLNLTTDPRYERVTGERMAIFCESGDAEQRNIPQQEETMMVQPIIVPLPGPVNLPIQFHGPMHAPPQPQPQPQPQIQIQHQPQISVQPQPIHFRPQQVPEVRTHTIIMEQLPTNRGPVPQIPQHLPPQPHQLPPHPLMQHIAQQIIAQHEMAAAAHRQQQIAQQQEEIAQRHQQMIQRHQEMAQRHQEMIRQQEMAQRQQEMAQNHHQEEPQHMNVPEAVIMAHRLPVPEEILSQVNRLPNQDVVVSVSEHEAEEVPQEDIRVVQHPRESAQEINGRQSYARGLPVHIPVPMMQQMQVPHQEEPVRPHYVQPRSVRSVDALLHREKRVKRCACDCAC